MQSGKFRSVPVLGNKPKALRTAFKRSSGTVLERSRTMELPSYTSFQSFGTVWNGSVVRNCSRTVPELFRVVLERIKTIAATCFFVALLLLIQSFKPKPQEPTLTQSQVDALLKQERQQWEAEQQALEHQQLAAEYQGFKDGVIYSRP